MIKNLTVLKINLERDPENATIPPPPPHPHFPLKVMIKFYVQLSTNPKTSRDSMKVLVALPPILKVII